MMLLMWLVPLLASADELKLKDGTKITGTIVGFEESSFKVKTGYGFAIVQRDQVVSISIADTTKKLDADKKLDSAVEKAPAPAKPVKTESPASSAPATPVTTKPTPVATKPAANSPPPSAATPPPVTVAATAKNTTPPANTAPTPTVASAPPKPPAPEPVREEVDGNTYTNITYGFHMYKPPDWQVIAGVRTVLPGAIAALGTSDQTTYLLIGQEPAGKSLSIDEDAAGNRLRDVMNNFRPLGEKHVTVSGIDAVEQRFRGSVDQHDWSGIVVFVPRSGRLYTIFGMTYAETDLVQIQENVISRVIASLQFVKP
jgi:hypothetical protein